MENDGVPKSYLPQAFVCAFCKQEFEQMSSVFSHMKEMHDSKHVHDELFPSNI